MRSARKTSRGHPSAQDSPPPVLPGFEHINRYWDKHTNVFTAKILPGEYYVTMYGEAIVTVLGSCVSACIRDRKLGIGGMNHFMLPATAEDNGLGAATRYGNYAMEHLINDILKNGGRRANLEVKVFGGGKILAQMTDVGKRNIEFVREYLHQEALEVVSEDLGDTCPRKVLYEPASGRARVKRLQSLHNNTVVERETEYMGHLAKDKVEGDIELF
ncbi:MAG TPA: chemoreceptor glutamine deamidase CheD [Gammaproteobacteria bacterium]|nr:chemoreceptor glutamine deamidase CheD [Gammaproteobacteria bacterium]